MARFCTNCGAELTEGSAFCIECGTPTNDGSPAAEQPTMATNETVVIDQVAPAGATSGVQSTTVIDRTAVMESAPAANNSAFVAPAHAPATTPAQASGGSKAPLIIAVVVAAVLIIAALIIAFFILNGGTPEQDKLIDESGTQAVTANACTVTFETGEANTSSSVVVDAGGTVQKPADPTRSGYTFGGWFSNEALTDPVTFPLTAEGDMTIYAKWNAGSSSSSNVGTGPTASTVTLTVVGIGGDTRTAEIHRQGTTGRVFPDSNTVRLTDEQVSRLSDAERCVAWNEIIASLTGYQFKNSGLRNYFTNDCAWYVPSGGSGSVSGVAAENVQLLKNHTNDWWEHLATN